MKDFGCQSHLAEILRYLLTTQGSPEGVSGAKNRIAHVSWRSSPHVICMYNVIDFRHAARVLSEFEPGPKLRVCSRFRSRSLRLSLVSIDVDSRRSSGSGSESGHLEPESEAEFAGRNRSDTGGRSQSQSLKVGVGVCVSGVSRSLQVGIGVTLGVGASRRA